MSQTVGKRHLCGFIYISKEKNFCKSVSSCWNWLCEAGAKSTFHGAIPRFDAVEVMRFDCCLNYLYQGSAVGPACTSGQVSLCVETRAAAVSFVTSGCRLSILDSSAPLPSGHHVTEDMSI